MRVTGYMWTRGFPCPLYTHLPPLHDLWGGHNKTEIKAKPLSYEKNIFTRRLHTRKRKRWEKAAQQIGDLMGAAASFFDRSLWYLFLSQFTAFCSLLIHVAFPSLFTGPGPCKYYAFREYYNIFKIFFLASVVYLVDWCTHSILWSQAVAAALIWVLVVHFRVLLFHSRTWVSAHKPNLRRERRSKKQLLKCSTFSESLFAKEFFHCQDNLMAFAEHGKFMGTSKCNM